jgi:hypothetical protein
MTLDEYKKHASEQEDWAPGWEAIDEVFEGLYPNQKPAHYGTIMTSRAIFGGDEYLDGYSLYQSPKGYMHLVTYGMTELYTDEKAFGGEWSLWGYEMTMKLKEDSAEKCMWAINMIGKLAHYTFTEKRYFEPLQYVSGAGRSINFDIESAITALLIVKDTVAEGIDTVHGRVDFLQLVGITQQEQEAIMADRSQAEVLVERMKQDNPDMVTNMSRTMSYL